MIGELQPSVKGRESAESRDPGRDGRGWHRRDGPQETLPTYDAHRTLATMSIVPNPSEVTPAELAVLHILWEGKPATVAEVHQRIYGDRDVGYTTTLRLLQNLHARHLVGRTQHGRQHRYHPLVDRESTLRRRIARLAREAFGGSEAALALHALGGATPTAEELAALRKLLDRFPDNEP